MIKFLLFAFVLEGYVAGNCENGWEVHMQECYKYVEDRVHHETAEKNCHDIGSSLVSIGSNKTNDFILRLAVTETWLGLEHTDKSDSRYKWVWPDGTTPEQKGYHNWKSDEPTGGDKCARIKLNGLWYGYKCHGPFSYMCVRPMQDSTTSSQTTLAATSTTAEIITYSTTTMGNTMGFFDTTIMYNSSMITVPQGSAQDMTPIYAGVGAAIALMILVVIIVILVIWCRRHKKPQEDKRTREKVQSPDANHWIHQVEGAEDTHYTGLNSASSPNTGHSPKNNYPSLADKNTENGHPVKQFRKGAAYEECILKEDADETSEQNQAMQISPDSQVQVNVIVNMNPTSVENASTQLGTKQTVAKKPKLPSHTSKDNVADQEEREKQGKEEDIDDLYAKPMKKKPDEPVPEVTLVENQIYNS